MRIWTTLLATLILAAATHAGAEEQVLNWVEYQSPDRGFAATFPHSPETTTAQVTGLNPLTRHSFRANDGDDTVYSIVVLEYPTGKGPKSSSQDLFTEMVAAYAKDSESRVRKKGAKTVANRDGYEAVVDDNARSKLSHLIDIVPDGDRLYMVISAGPKSHATGDAAEQFRDSFRLLSDPDPTGSTHATSAP